MNLTRNSALIEQLAASYALGTLRGGARRRFEGVARGNAAVRAAALIWQGRLASVAELQPEAAPSAAVWKRIENLVAADKQAKAMQAARASRTADMPAKPSWLANLNVWRGMAGAGAMAAVLMGVVGLTVNNSLNERGNAISASLNAANMQALKLDSEVQLLTAKLQAAPEIQYVAVLSDDKAAASMLVTFDPKSKKLTLKRVGGYQEQADKSMQLWALPQTGGPRSLGVLGRDAIIKLTAVGNDVKAVPTLAISLEPKGGVPSSGGPTGPVLFKGALIETTL